MTKMLWMKLVSGRQIRWKRHVKLSFVITEGSDESKQKIEKYDLNGGKNQSQLTLDAF